jgi:hypothetical protein
MPTLKNKYVPGHVFTHVAKHSPRTAMALMNVSSNLRRSLRVPSQRRVAMGMLPNNFAHRLTAVGIVPRHMPMKRGGKYTRGHNTIQNLMKRYRTLAEQKQQLNMLLWRMKHNNASLPNRVKARLNKMFA